MALLLLGACDKPAPEDCKKALLNMQHLMGTEDLNAAGNGELDSEVRRCQGESSKEAVACAVKATSMAELKRCAFYHVPDNTGSGSSGSGK
ncbi:MAG TPA: hypothetical protein VLX92_05100 [Kofleriaceae bacterium]|nr:hypothetical protein [Kofleriaceae bacterium]